MSADRDTIEVPLTLRLSPQARDAIAKRAAAAGADESEYVSQLVEQIARKPFSLEEISGTAYQRFLESGVSDEQLSEELERGKHELRTERRNRRAS